MCNFFLCDQRILLEYQADSTPERRSPEDQAVRVPRRVLSVGLCEFQRKEATRKTAAQPRHQDETGLPARKHHCGVER